MDDRKQDSSTTAVHSKHIVELLHKGNVLMKKSTIWDNTDKCAEQYRCVTALYLISMLSHSYNILFDRGVGSPVHGIYVVDGLNATDNFFLQC